MSTATPIQALHPLSSTQQSCRWVLTAALLIPFSTNCAAPQPHYFRASATISPSSKTSDKPAPLSFLPNWEQTRNSAGMTLTFRPPAKCLDENSKTPITRVSLTTCMPALAKLESLAADAGYQIVSWQHLVGPYYLERASLFNVDAIIDVTKLEIQPMSAPAYNIDKIEFAWQKSMGDVEELNVKDSKKLGKSCQEHFKSIVKSIGQPLVGSIDVTVTSVADARTIARYTQSIREEIEVEPIVRFYQADGDANKRKVRWRVGMVLAGLGAGFLVGAGIAHQASAGVKAGLVGTGAGLFAISIPIAISKQSRVEYPPPREILCRGEFEHKKFPPAEKRASEEKDPSGTSFEPKPPKPSDEAKLAKRKANIQNQLLSNLFESLGKVGEKTNPPVPKQPAKNKAPEELFSKEHSDSSKEDKPSENEIEIQADVTEDLIMDEGSKTDPTEQPPSDKKNKKDK